MRVVAWNLDDVVSLAELFAALVEDNAVLVHVFGLADDGRRTLRTSAFAAQTTWARRFVTTEGAHWLRSKPGSRHWLTTLHALALSCPASHILRHRIVFIFFLSHFSSGHHVPGARVSLCAAKFVGVLNQVVSVGLRLAIFVFPLVHRVGGLLVLEAAQDGLVLHCDASELFLALFSVQTDDLVTFYNTGVGLGDDWVWFMMNWLRSFYWWSMIKVQRSLVKGQ